jgi:hypothetical protein
MNKKISTFWAMFITIVLAAFVGSMIIFNDYYYEPLESINLVIKKPKSLVACTMEAKICPDGSSVGRIGPNCEFAECPGISDGSENWKVYKNEQYGFEFEYSAKESGTINEPEATQCDVGNGAVANCKVFIIPSGIAVAVIDHAFDEKAINKYKGSFSRSDGSQFPVAQPSIINMGGVSAYKYDFVSSVNYKIYSIQLPLDKNVFLEFVENSKNPTASASDWYRIVSTFKFAK